MIAAAGSGKTQLIIDSALAVTDGRVLITTYTVENLRQLTLRLEESCGSIPKNIMLMTWYDFLVNQGARPYQASYTGRVGAFGSMNFLGKASRYASRTESRRYLDPNGDLYRDGVSDLICQINERSNGAVIRRLQTIFSEMFIDEIQDLVGYDLELLDLLFASEIAVTVVGDPRQHTYSTNTNPKNRMYRGSGLVTWLQQRSALCVLETRAVSHRCNQAICDFADGLFPDLPKTTSLNPTATDHDGIFIIERAEVGPYIERWSPVVLRENRSYDTIGCPAINIGVAKGSTFDRVLIFSNRPMLHYVETRDLPKLKQRDRLYVAVTRARHSATFVRR